jgi:hypothetical protein
MEFAKSRRRWLHHGGIDWKEKLCRAMMPKIEQAFTDPVK